MNKWIVLSCLGLLGGCAGSGFDLVGSPASGPCTEPSQEQALALNLAQEMAVEGRRHAALANLQKLPRGLPQVRLGEARILRSLDQPEAEAMYRSLLGSCLAAEGEHGLGQLAAARGDHAQALERLQRARRLEPTNARVRNDLGIAYLGAGRQDEARFEFLTALELDQNDSQPALNLLALLFYQDRWPQAADLASRLGLSATQVRAAEALARRLREGNARAGLETPAAEALADKGDTP